MNKWWQKRDKGKKIKKGFLCSVEELNKEWYKNKNVIEMLKVVQPGIVAKFFQNKVTLVTAFHQQIN